MLILISDMLILRSASRYALETVLIDISVRITMVSYSKQIWCVRIVVGKVVMSQGEMQNLFSCRSGLHSLGSLPSVAALDA